MSCWKSDQVHQESLPPPASGAIWIMFTVPNLPQHGEPHDINSGKAFGADTSSSLVADYARMPRSTGATNGSSIGFASRSTFKILETDTRLLSMTSMDRPIHVSSVSVAESGERKRLLRETVKEA